MVVWSSHKLLVDAESACPGIGESYKVAPTLKMKTLNGSHLGDRGHGTNPRNVSSPRHLQQNKTKVMSTRGAIYLDSVEHRRGGLSSSRQAVHCHKKPALHVTRLVLA